MKKYTALTIGPIYKTLQSVKSTKAIWAASYMFSYLMRDIIKKAKLTKDKVILPYFEENDLTEKFEVGLFPDRLLIKGEVSDLQDIISKAIKELATKVNEDISSNKDEVFTYLNDYLSIHTMVVELKESENAIFELNKLLDTSELKQKVLKDADKDYLSRLLEDTYYNFFIRDEFDKAETSKDNRRFPSTIEIANSALKDINEKQIRYYINELFKKTNKEDNVDNQQKFIDKIRGDKQFNLSYRNYQKYITVVQADGDNIGAFIKQLYSLPNKDKLIERFSKNLLEFGKQSVKLIKIYQGTPIYAGGDDLLFFCPVAHSENIGNENKPKVIVKKSFLTLINEIDKVFNSLFTNYNMDGIDFMSIIEKAKKEGVKVPSMSYGVSVSYYKFPLNEALDEGVNQLFYTAKQTSKKDAVSYTILKHSGQKFGAVFHKQDKSYCTYLELLRQHVSDENFLHGVVYKLEPQKMVFCSIGKEADQTKRNKMFDNFFFNNFDENTHRKWDNKDELIPFLEKLKQLFKDVYTENQVVKCDFENEEDETKNSQNNKNLSKIYAALRFIGFLHNKEER